MDVKSTQYAEKVRRWSDTSSWLAEAMAFVKHCPKPISGDWLDVGCGTGRMAGVLQDATTLPVTYQGLEVNPNYNGSGAVYNGRGRFPFAPDTFDGAVIFAVLGHTHDPSEILHQTWKSVKKCGVVGICVPNLWHGRVQAPVDKMTGYVTDPTLTHDFTVRRIHALCDKYFEDVRVTTWGPRALGVGPKLRLFAWGRV
jgi:SAM-dependent methyltransferase